jgi:hypothetical protein
MDGAQFESAEDATDRTDARKRLASVVERFGNAHFLEKAVPILRQGGLSDLADARFVKDHYRRLSPLFLAYEKRVRGRGQVVGRVALVDLTEEPVTVISKFSQYREYPSATYSVVVTAMSQGIKISVGYNPWCQKPLDANIGALCARHGGGGHPFVGAISFEQDRTADALALASRLVESLQSPDPESPPA